MQVADVAGAAGDERHRPAAVERPAKCHTDRPVEDVLRSSSLRGQIRSATRRPRYSLIVSTGRVSRTPPSIARFFDSTPPPGPARRCRTRASCRLNRIVRPGAGCRIAGQLGVALAQVEPALPQQPAADLPGAGVRCRALARGAGRGGRGRGLRLDWRWPASEERHAATQQRAAAIRLAMRRDVAAAHFGSTLISMLRVPPPLGTTTTFS